MTVNDSVLNKARKVRLLVLDVDGVLTDGTLYFHADGSETKAFNNLDSHGIKMLQSSGVEVVIITGRRSPLVSQRAKALGISLVYQGREDKLVALKEVQQKKALQWEQIAYCGDDLPDLAAIRMAGLGVTVPNAPEYMQQHSDYVCMKSGGHGAVRELCDLIMQTQGTLQDAIDHYLLGG